MNRRFIANTVGKIMLCEAALLVLPIAVSIYYHELCTIALTVSAIISLILGLLLTLLVKPRNHIIYARDGFITVTLSWVMMSLVGALPFTLSGEIPSYVDALFETVSGFTTTGASILGDVESVSKGLLFWRSFTHWVGGMGVLVFVMAIVPSATDRAMHILRAEMPGPVKGKLVPRAKETAKILYLIYIVMTVIEIVVLRLEGMPMFESILHSFGTAGTGGFGLKGDSIAGYSAEIQITIATFMLLFGINFNLYYLLLLGQLRTALRSSELWCYLGMAAVTVTIIAVNISGMFSSFGEALRHSYFQVSSIITTTGYGTADFNSWPGLSKGLLLMLMFIGGCAGSTAGGLKVSRIMILLKTVQKELRKLIHPRSVSAVRLDGKTLDDTTLNNVNAYFVVYMVCYGIIFLALCFEPFDIETNISAVTACFNNIGPGLGLVGPTSNYSCYSDLSKLVLSFAMLLGRLEIFPLLLTLSPSTWIKK